MSFVKLLTVKVIYLTAFFLGPKCFSESFSYHKPLLPVFQTLGREALVLDLSSDVVLYEKNATKKMFPSSMSKAMTAYLVFTLLKNGDMSLNDLCSVSQEAAAFRGGTCMFLKPHQDVSIENLIKGIIVVSANDGCLALAQYVAGTEEEFVNLMNNLAQEIGMNDSHFANASGWPNPKHWTTCHDLAVVARKTIEDFPQEYRKYYSMKEFSFNGIRQKNLNPVLKDGLGDGLKTGFTNDAGYGIIGSQNKEYTLFSSYKDNKGTIKKIPHKVSRRILFILNGLKSSGERKVESNKILSWANNAFQPFLLAKKNQFIHSIPVWKGARPTLKIISPKTIVFPVPKQFKRKVEVVIRHPNLITSYVKKGDEVAQLVLRMPKSGEGMPLECKNQMKKNGGIIKKQNLESSTSEKTEDSHMQEIIFPLVAAHDVELTWTGRLSSYFIQKSNSSEKKAS